MKYRQRNKVTVRRQAAAVYGYGTAVFDGASEYGIIARTKIELEALFLKLAPPGWEINWKKVRRVAWVDARKVSTTKRMQWPPLNGGAGK
jgi:hypothetical protein